MHINTSMTSSNDLKNLGDLLDPEKNKDFEYLFVTDSDGKIHVVNKELLIKSFHTVKGGGPSASTTQYRTPPMNMGKTLGLN